MVGGTARNVAKKQGSLRRTSFFRCGLVFFLNSVENGDRNPWKSQAASERGASLSMVFLSAASQKKSLMRWVDAILITFEVSANR
jgi:hypothetical protein